MGNYPADWPPQQFQHNAEATTWAEVEVFKALLDANAGERELDAFFKEHPSMLAAALRPLKAGRHGSWVIPQQHLRPPIKGVRRGQIPDYIVGGKRANRFEWWLVALKGANVPIFIEKRSGLRLSASANRGLCQLLDYSNFANEHNEFLREQLGLTHFFRPGGILVIGRNSELERLDSHRGAKTAWNRLVGSNLQIRTYDSILRAISRLLGRQDSPKRTFGDA